MEQYISNVKGPCVILAGAGTGKTYSIIEKLKYLISRKVYPIERIVCLTFSNEAVNTLRQRILPHLHEQYEPIIRTFHSFCAEMLRKHSEKIGLKQNFKIMTPDDGKILLHKYFKINPYLCNKYIGEISMSKDIGKTLEESSNNVKTSSEEIENISFKLEELKFKINTAHLKKISKDELNILKNEKEKIEEELNKSKFIQAWKSYEKIKSTRNGLDYADLHHKALELLNKNPEIANEFDYIIVDEFQDTNKLQCLILEKIAPHKNITVVGDLNQSIYRFRGAYDENFGYFKEVMGVTPQEIHALDKSYRSTNKILTLAHELIKNNYLVQEECFKVKNAYNKNGENIKVYSLKNGKEEVRKIIEIIKEEIKRGTPMKEICIIFRTHQQSATLKKQLEYEEIPCTSINKESLLKTPIIKTVRAYLTIIEKLINKSKGGDGAWWDLIHYSLKEKSDELIVAQTIRKFKGEDCISLNLMDETKIEGLSAQGEIQLQAIRNHINSLLNEKSSPIQEIIKNIYSLLGVQEEVESKKALNLSILEKFYEFTKDFVETDSQDLSSLIHHLITIDALDISIEFPILIKEGIRIMTNHATKGLEYQVVIMSSLVQKKFPIERLSKQEALDNLEENMKKQIMEERRLCYVGFTRAKDRLYLTYAKDYGQRAYEPSQFLKEINYQNNEIIDFIKDESELYRQPKEIIQESKNEDFSNQKISFSPSALQMFDECQKRYEMKYVYSMPDPTPQSWEAIMIGNFVHRVLEKGVKNVCKTLKEFEDCAKVVQMEEYKDINLNDVIPLIKIFFERNKTKYNENSKTEQYLQTTIEGIKFNGYADRIDINDDGELSIIDYKTGKGEIKPKYRNWQLGIYALASANYGKPKSLILEMLQKEYPLEFILDNQGIAKEIHSPRTQFNLNQIREEIVETAKKILNARKTSFRSCSPEKNCQFCQELTHKFK